MRCPECDEEDAYTGLRGIHCTNPKCRFYDARYADKLRQEKDGKPSSDYTSYLDDKVERLITVRKRKKKDS